MRPSVALALALLVPVSTAQAQLLDRLTNPTVSVKLSHPPGLGLKINKVAFGPATGTCADEIVQTLIADFVANHIEVVDRQNLAAILAEHNLTLGGYVDPESAAAIGKILGPSALIFVRTQRCASQQDRLVESETRYNNQTKTNYTVPAYYGRTRSFLKASVQTVDLATGRIFAARTLDYSPEKSNKSYQGYPAPPAEFEVLEDAIQSAVTDIHRMFLPWSERTKLVYYNDKDCGLKQAYEALERGDNEGAFRLSEQNLEACKKTPGVKDKVLGHAYYNVGMSHMMQDVHDRALEHFEQAARLRPGDVVKQAMSDCRKARELTLAMQQVEDKAAFEADRQRAEGERAAEAEIATTLSNADVIQMVQSKLPDSIIIHKIKTSKCSFDTSTDALVALANSGVSQEVIIAMMGP